MQRVLFVDHAEVLGGAEHSLLLLLKHLDRARIEPVLACSPGRLAEETRALGIVVETVTLPRLRRSLAAPLRLWRGARELAAIALQHQCGLLCSNTMRASYYAAPAAWLCHRPLVWYVRDVFPSGGYVCCMSRRAVRIIAVSQAAAAPLTAAGVKLVVIPNGVELSAFGPGPSPNELRQAWGCPPEAFVVGLVGRVRSTKGQHHFVEAMARASQQHEQLWGIIIGDTLFEGEEDYLPGLKALARRLGVQQRIVFAGHSDQVPEVLRALDAHVSCSLYPESFGRTIIEGMASGLPVIAYDHGGPSELITSGRDGLLVKPLDIQALAQQIARLAEDAPLCQSLSKGALETAQRYDMALLTRSVEDVLLAAGQAGRTPCT